MVLLFLKKLCFCFVKHNFFCIFAKKINMENKEFIIVRGLPGSGKSTFAEKLAKAFGGVVCTADDFFTDEDGNYNWSKDKLKDAHGYCKSKFLKALIQDEKCVILANTSTREAHIQGYIDIALQYGYTVTSIIVENRHGGQNVHNVPDASIKKMKDEFEIKL